MRKLGLFFFINLFLISCLGQISSDLYLPALPIIRISLHTTEHLLQITLATYMLGFSVSHLFYGPISDWMGRKKPLIAGMFICIIGTLLCRFSPDINTLIVGRVLQGVGAGAGSALFLSILRDVYTGNQLAKVSSFINISRVLLLACSPLIGGYLLHFFDWRACFTFLFLYCLFCLIGTLFILKETNVHQNAKNIKITIIAKNISSILTNKTFMTYVFFVMLAFGGILAWLTSLPFLLENVVGLTPIEFGAVSAVAGLFFIIGGLINAFVVERFSLEKMLFVGLLIMLLASIIMLGFGLIGDINTSVIMIPVCIYIIGSSFIFSNAYAGAMETFAKTAGTAAALFGFLQILGGACSSWIISLVHNDTQIPLALTLLCTTLIALFIQYLGRKAKLN